MKNIILLFLVFATASVVSGSFETGQLSIVLRKDYKDVVTSGKMVLPVVFFEDRPNLDTSVDAPEDPFSKSLRLLKYISQKNMKDIKSITSERDWKYIQVWVDRYSGVASDATPILAAQIGANPVVFWSVRHGSSDKEFVRYFSFEVSGDRLIWVPNLKDPIISLVASSLQRDPSLGSPDWREQIKDPVSENSLKISLLSDVSLLFNDVLSLDPNSASKWPLEAATAIEILKIGEEALRGGRFSEYASLLTESSSVKFEKWYLKLSEAERRQFIEDRFRFNREYTIAFFLDPYLIVCYVLGNIGEDSGHRAVGYHYLTKDEGSWKITNVGFEGYFDDLVSKYKLLPMEQLRFVENYLQSFNFRHQMNPSSVDPAVK